MTGPGDDPLLASLLAAVAAAPGEHALRLHVAEVLLDRGRPAEALEHCAVVLRAQPAHAPAIAVLRRASAALAGGPVAGPAGGPPAGPTGGPVTAAGRTPLPEEFDWAAAEAQVGDIVPPTPGADPLPD